MKRVVSFKDYEKAPCNKLNAWLRDHPDVTLVDIKPVVSKTDLVTLYAIVEVNEKNEGERET